MPSIRSPRDGVAALRPFTPQGATPPGSAREIPARGTRRRYRSSLPPAVSPAPQGSPGQPGLDLFELIRVVRQVVELSLTRWRTPRRGGFPSAKRQSQPACGSGQDSSRNVQRERSGAMALAWGLPQAAAQGTHPRQDSRSARVPVHVAKVGARSTWVVKALVVWPAGTPGPRTTRKRYPGSPPHTAIPS